MAKKLVACPECGSSVPYGRLSCPSCGTLLASVVGQGHRPLLDVTPGSAEREAEAEPEPEAEAEPEPAPEPELEFERDGARPLEADAVGAPETASAPEPASRPRRATTTIERTRTDRLPAGPVDAPESAATLPIPGAYLAPSRSFSTPLAAHSRAATNPPPASAEAIRSTPPTAPALARSAGPVPPSTLGAPPATGRFHAASRELQDWLVAGGAALAIASFVLRWATDGVIGSRGSGYTATWGLANPGHLLLIVAAAAVVALIMRPNRTPAWIRTVVAPIVLGGAVAGLAFAYVARPIGGGAGVTLALLGAFAMVIGGALDARAGRRGSDPPSV